MCGRAQTHPLPASSARSMFCAPTITTRSLNSGTGIVRIRNASNQNRAYSSNASRVAWATRASVGSAPSTRAWLAATVARTPASRRYATRPSVSNTRRPARSGSDMASHSALRYPQYPSVSRLVSGPVPRCSSGDVIPGSGAGSQALLLHDLARPDRGGEQHQDRDGPRRPSPSADQARRDQAVPERRCDHALLDPVPERAPAGADVGGEEPRREREQRAGREPRIPGSRHPRERTKDTAVEQAVAERERHPPQTIAGPQEDAAGDERCARDERGEPCRLDLADQQEPGGDADRDARADAEERHYRALAHLRSNGHLHHPREGITGGRAPRDESDPSRNRGDARARIPVPFPISPIGGPLKTYEAKDIRNVLLVGHGGAGKTTLLEAMLLTSGATTR